MPHLGDVFFIFKTGRERSVRLGGPIDAKWTNATACRNASKLGGYVVYSAQVDTYIKGLGIELTIGYSTPIPASLDCSHDPIEAVWRQSVYAQVVDVAALSPDDVPSAEGHADYSWLSPGGSVVVGGTGTWSVQVEAEEYAAVYFLDEGVRGADGSPNYGGPATDDVIPRAFGIRLYEVAKVGGHLVGNLTIGRASATCSVEITPDNQFGIGYGVRRVVEASARNTSISGSIGGYNLGPPHVPLEGVDSWTSDHTSVTLTPGNLVVTASSPGPDDNYEAIGDYVCLPRYEYKAKAAAYAMGSLFPGMVPFDVQGVPSDQGHRIEASPAGTLDFHQVAWSGSAITEGVHHPLVGVNNVDNVRVRVAASEIGEDPTDWRAMIAGKKYAGFDLGQDVDRSAGPVTSQGDVFRIDYGSPPGNWEGYRYLRVRLSTGGDGETVTVVADGDPGKVYTLKTVGTALRSYLVDLCAPDSPVPEDDPDLWDSRLPLRNDGLPDKDPSGWGIGRVRSVSFAGGTNLIVQSVDLHRETAPILDPAPAFLDWELTQTDASYHADGSVGSVPIVQASRGIVMTTDGRRSQIQPVGIRQLFDTPDGPIWVYSFPTASRVETWASATPGVHAGHGGYTPSDAWHARDGSEGVDLITGGPVSLAGWAGFVAGGGVLWDGYTPTNQIGKPIGSGAQELYLQPRYDEFFAYPGCGDWSGSDGYNVPMPIRAAKILRAGADGLLLGGGTATLYDEGHAPVGSGAADTWLRFRTGLPYGRGQRDHTIEAGSAVGSFVGDWDPSQGLGTDDEATQERWNARRFHRAVFRTIVQRIGAKNPHMVPSPDGRIYLAYGKGAALWARELWHGGTHTEHESKIADDGFRPRLAIDPRDGRLVVHYERGGAMLQRTSRDGGRTWSPETNMGYGYRPEPVASPLKALVRLRLEKVTDDRYEVRVAHRTDAPGIVWSSETTVTDESGAPLACQLEGWGGVVAPWHLGGGWVLAMVPYGESSLATYRSKERNALTFRRIP